MGNCKQEDLTNEYVITMNSDYTIPEDEGLWGKNNVNMFWRSKEGKQYTLKRSNKDLVTLFEGATLRIENVILDGNNNAKAIGVMSGTLTLGKGTIVQNFTEVQGFDGPAIYLTGSATLNIEEGAIIKDNRSDDQGGAIGANDETTTININGGSFINNFSSKYGGAIATWGVLNINGGTFEKNKSPYGGAIAAFKKATPTISNATFKGNTANKQGGAIISWSELSIENTTFENNEATWGGALYLQGGAEITDSSFTENSSTYNGGSIFSINDKLNLNSSKFIKKSSNNAGAVYIKSPTDESVINDCIFSENNAIAQGGALWSNDVKTTINNGTFEDNISGSYGGALCFNGDKEFIVNKSTIKNSKSKLGGGIFEMGGSLSLEGSTIESNIAEAVDGDEDSGAGGGILSLEGKSISLDNCLIKNNEALNGAGVLVGAGKAEIKESEFNGNDTGEDGDQTKLLGGGLYIDANATANIRESSKFINNKSGMGGAIFDASCDYNNPADEAKYQNLTIDKTTVFKGNVARIGLFAPPVNYDKFTNLAFSANSETPYNKYMSKSLLNNYDINYKGKLLIVYDANGGKFENGQEIITELHKENDEIKLMKAPTRKGYKFLYWSKEEFKPGNAYKVSGNQNFLAQWEKIEPPKPDEPKKLTMEEEAISCLYRQIGPY